MRGIAIYVYITMLYLRPDRVPSQAIGLVIDILGRE